MLASDGSYCVQVTDPSGQTVLGVSDAGAVTVVGGEFVQCYQLTVDPKDSFQWLHSIIPCPVSIDSREQTSGHPGGRGSR